MPDARVSHRGFIATTALLFVLSSITAVVWCRSMGAMGTMAMPGGWTMSMSWMRMPGQSWLGCAASFVGMWVVMMAAMMLPSLAPMLRRYRGAVERTRETSLSWLTAAAGTGYLLIWAMWGVVIFPFGAALAQLEMNLPALARAVPATIAGIVLCAGLVQFSGWKLRSLACCRNAPEASYTLADDTRAAIRHGLRLGFHCSLSCANLTAILLVSGVMDLRMMALVTATITAERIAPDGVRVAKATGIGIIAIALYLAARAIRAA